MIPPPLQASKWISIQVLLNREEMDDLVDTLGSFSIYLTQPNFHPLVRHDQFLETYGRYLADLQSETIPESSEYRAIFSTFWSQSEEAVVQVPVRDKLLCRAVQPVIQLQYHVMGYSPFDGKFRPMVMGKDSIHWGVQFSYPQLFQDPTTQSIRKVDQSFENTALFQSLRRWIRNQTVPTPFIVNNIKTNAPIRIGKKNLGWISAHPQLVAQGIQVQEGSCA